MTTPIVLSHRRASPEIVRSGKSGLPSKAEIDEAIAYIDVLVAARRRRFMELLSNRPHYDGAAVMEKVTQRLLAMNQQRSAVTVLQTTRKLLVAFRKVAPGSPARTSQANRPGRDY